MEWSLWIIMKNYAFKSEEDFESKKEDILILLKKVKDRIKYIGEKASQILKSDNSKTYEIFINVENIFGINIYEIDCKNNEFISYHSDLNIPRNTSFKDKFGNEMDLRYQMPRRWLMEDFEEELEKGLYIIKDHLLDILIKEKELIGNLVESLNLSDEQKNMLGISKKIKEISEDIECYNY